MNEIPKYQNQPKQLMFLAAQRALYSKAKTILAIQLILVVPFAGTLSMMAAFSPSMQNSTTLLCFLIVILDITILDSWQKRLLKQAAKIQEAFDCNVLGLELEEAKIGKLPDSKTVEAYAEKYRQTDPGYSKLTDWYRVTVEQVPLNIACIICQRINIGWDKSLHRRYARIILYCITIMAIFLTSVYYIANNMTLRGFIYTVVAPLFPAFIRGILEFKKQIACSDNLDSMEKQGRELWEKACSKAFAKTQLEEKSRALQNEIYDHRRSAPLVFDCIYRHFHKRSQNEVNRFADTLVNQYLEFLRQPAQTQR